MSTQFWGVVIKPNSSEAFNVPPGVILNVTQSCLGPDATAKHGRHVVYANYEDKSFAVTSLTIGIAEHARLDLMFEGGSEVAFQNTGKSDVHLTGTLMVDGDMMGMEFGEGEEESDEEEMNGAAGKGGSGDNGAIEKPTKIKFREPISEDDSSVKGKKKLPERGTPAGKGVLKKKAAQQAADDDEYSYEDDEEDALPASAVAGGDDESEYETDEEEAAPPAKSTPAAKAKGTPAKATPGKAAPGKATPGKATPNKVAAKAAAAESSEYETDSEDEPQVKTPQAAGGKKRTATPNTAPAKKQKVEATPTGKKTVAKAESAGKGAHECSCGRTFTNIAAVEQHAKAKKHTVVK